MEGVSPLALEKHMKIGFSQQLWRNSCWFQRCRCAGEEENDEDQLSEEVTFDRCFYIYGGPEQLEVFLLSKDI